MTRLLLLCVALLALRVASAAFVVWQPGYTDAYYYALVAERLARGEGLTADFVWNFIEAPDFAPLPVASHRFWMPLASGVQAAGIGALGDALGPFRAAQSAIVLAAALVPAATYAAARSLGVGRSTALAAAALAGLGGAFAPAWVSLDTFAPAALLGTAFFLSYARAAAGDARAGALAGSCAGALYLARAEGALFGVALLALLAWPRSRRAGLLGSAAALAFGLVWLARGVVPDLLARSALLVRYEDFFRIASLEGAEVVAQLGEFLGAKPAALAANAATAAAALFVFLVPGLARGARSLWDRPEVRAFVGLGVLVYLLQSLVWTLHSTRGSYFHSLSSLFPFAVALSVAGSELLIRSRAAGAARLAAATSLAAAALLSVVALVGWDGAFNTPYRARLLALDAIPAGGPLIAIDAAAWRWVSGRPVLVTPADGIAEALCAAAAYGARALVLEPAHFSAYAALYRGEAALASGAPLDRGGIRVYSLAGARCARER